MTTLHKSAINEASAGRGEPIRERVTARVAVVVPHTHWDREWHAPFETMRFHLVRFLDELIDTLESEPDLPAFLLDGQSVILEDYLDVRVDQRSRVEALVAAGKLRPGPFYVQPDELLVSGESLVHNLLLGCQVAARFGRVMREGYLPDTFGHVHQLPQILRGFEIETFYAMRGFADDPDDLGTEFFWQAPDGSTVLVSWLSESYSNAAVLSSDATNMPLHHGALVRYDSLDELLERMSQRTRTGVLLLMNGGDHLRVQAQVPTMVSGLQAGTEVQLRLGGLEEYHHLMMDHLPDRIITGELRYGRKHDVFDGIGSTRTPLKQLNERVESQLSGVAERVCALAEQMGGPSSGDSLRYAWRELVKNHAHDSICGCSVDEVHQDMVHRYRSVQRVADAVTDDALDFIARAVATPAEGAVPIVVVNPSAHQRSDRVEVDVVPDLQAPLGVRKFGWTQQPGVNFADYELRDPLGHQVPFLLTHPGEVSVKDILDRRKEVIPDRISFLASAVGPLSTAVYQLRPRSPVSIGDTLTSALPLNVQPTVRTAARLSNSHLELDITSNGTLCITHLATGRSFTGLVEFLEDGDAGDEYSFGPIAGDEHLSSTASRWTVVSGADTDTLIASAVLTTSEKLSEDRRGRSARTVEVPIGLTVRLAPLSDRVDIDVSIDNHAEDHRVRLRFPTGTGHGHSISESAYGLMHRGDGPAVPGQWQEAPSGVHALRRFLATRDEQAGLQILTEGLHEYSCSAHGVVDVTLLRSVGWLARTDHPLRTHKVGPMVPTPEAQCPGQHTFRIALRPFAATELPGQLYRSAEEFTVPLQARAMQSRWQRSAGSSAALTPTPFGLSVEPAEAVLSAVKPAENGDGIIVRIFNAADSPVNAVLKMDVDDVELTTCTLQEKPIGPRTPVLDRTTSTQLAPGVIATLRLSRAEQHQRQP